MPGGFSFNSFGLLNSIDVRISPWTNTEYYRIEITGPYNYDTGGGDPPVLTMTARPGSNIVPVVNPSGDPIDPGLYSVNVYAVNNNIPGGVVSSHGAEYVLVNYERYSDQKKDLASIAGGYFDLTALDLEVNFNNGDGWYRLMLSGNDTGERLIDCRYTSYYEQDRQRFHLFFRPPTGEVDPLNPTTNDVFSGGRQEADLYIRTVAENRYRDTFWPRKSDTGNPTISTGTDVVNIINYWTGNPYSDASFIEETIAGAHNDGFSLSSSLVGDYFFSPLEYRAFTIKTILTDTIPDADTSPIDEPVFYAEEGDSLIEISNISSVYGYKYRIYWLYVDGYTPEQIDNLGNDTFLDNWNSTGEIMASALGAVGTPTNSYTIPDLIPNREYVVAVRGYNSYGKGSKPVFIKYTENNSNVEHIQSYIPFSTVAPAKPAGISLGLGVDGKSIHVDRIYVPDPNVDMYEVRWYRLADNVATSDTVSSDGVHYASYLIQNLNFWDSYAVQARARRVTSGVWGEWSDPVMIETADYESGNITLSSVTSNVSGISWSNRPSVMTITLSGLGSPTGTVSYNVNYTLTLIYDDPDYTNFPSDWHDSGYTNIVSGTLSGSNLISYTFNSNESPFYNSRWYGYNGDLFSQVSCYNEWTLTKPQFVSCEHGPSIVEEVEYKPHVYLDLTVEAVNSYNESITRDFHYTVLP